MNNSPTTFRYGRVHVVSHSGTSAATAVPFPEHITHARITATSDIYYRVVDTASDTVTAANGVMLLAGQIDFPKVRPGEHIAVLQVSASGTTNITECTQ